MSELDNSKPKLFRPAWARPGGGGESGKLRATLNRIEAKEAAEVAKGKAQGLVSDTVLGQALERSPSPDSLLRQAMIQEEMAEMRSLHEGAKEGLRSKTLLGQCIEREEREKFAAEDTRQREESEQRECEPKTKHRKDRHESARQ